MRRVLSAGGHLGTFCLAVVPAVLAGVPQPPARPDFSARTGTPASEVTPSRGVSTRVRYRRGRMTGINMVFFQGGPQLGELEAGAVAQWIGARGSVVTGGIGCLIATAWIAARTPALRQYRRSFIDASEQGRLRSMVR